MGEGRGRPAGMAPQQIQAQLAAIGFPLPLDETAELALRLAVLVESAEALMVERGADPSTLSPLPASPSPEQT